MMLKKTYNAIDVLKFIMALLVIMIHVKPNVHCEFLQHFFSPLMSISVPCFFIISSVLLFSKLNGNGMYLFRYCKRIGLLYLCWFIIDGWFILNNKPYFSLDGGILKLLKDLIFATTFPGSWYLSASIMGVLIVYYLNKLFHPILVLIITYLIACYISRVQLLPEYLRIPYYWYAATFHDEVNLSFPAQMVWISIGQVISLHLYKIENAPKQFLLYLVATFVVSFVLCMFTGCLELRILMSVSIVCACLFIDIPSKSIYKKLRSYSILMFFFHFSIAGKMRYMTLIMGDSLLTNWLFYLIVITISILFADLVLRLEKTKYLSFLRFIH